MGLEDYRQQIDIVDKELTKLFEKRMDIVLKVAEYKKQNNIEILNQNRESEVLQRVINQINNKDYITETQSFFKDLFSTSRELQKRKIQEQKLLENISEKTKLGIPGTTGSFSQEAAQKFFSEKFEILQQIFYPTFAKVLEALQKKEIDIAIMPIQNIIVGEVTETSELLKKQKYNIITYITIKISHSLLVLQDVSLQDIKEIISHPQALAQCSYFIKKSGYKTREYTSTSTAAQLIQESNDKTVAAIAGKEAAKLFGLNILKENIANNSNNYTQFAIITL